MKQKINQTKNRLNQKLNFFIVQTFKTVIKPFSRFFRKIFELANIQGAFGVFIFLSVISLVVLPTSLSAIQTAIDTRYTKNQVALDEIIKTEKTLRLPLASYIITQKFHILHPGIDFAAPKGAPIYPVMDGKIISVGYSRFGYGNHVVVQHKNGLTSLYAHLSKIEVKPGETVTKQAIIGLVGSTGWSTGPHLHFEIRQEGIALNPKGFFEAYYGERLASKK